MTIDVFTQELYYSSIHGIGSTVNSATEYVVLLKYAGPGESTFLEPDG